MIRSMYRSSKGELSYNLLPEELHDALADTKGTLWLDVIHLPDKRGAVGDFLRDLFAFHPLALDDALTETHIPRIDDWQDYLYIVLHPLDLEVNRMLDSHELDMFLGRNYLVTIHCDPIQSLDRIWNQCTKGAKHHMASGADHLLYTLADTIVADYMPVVDGLDDEIDELQDEIFHRPIPGTVQKIFRLRRTIIRLRRILGSLREVMNRLARDSYSVVDAKDRVYFRDVYDHLVRLYDIVEGLRDMIGGALDSYLSVTSNRLNEIMRTLTVVTVLLMPLTFITGFFGMNFFADAYNVDNPFEPTVLFWLGMASMILLPPGMIWWMARRGWLRSTTADEAEPKEPAKAEKS